MEIVMANKKIEPTHPGNVLLEEMQERDISINFLARALRVPPSRVDEIVKRRRAVTAETALRLARFFGASAQFWLNLQTGYDLAVATSKLAAAIEREVLPHKVT
jgi:antitoxin HigA-1